MTPNIFKTVFSLELLTITTVLVINSCTYVIMIEYSYEWLDGSVRGEERFLAVKKFTEDDDVFVFLLSTRAGQE